MSRYDGRETNQLRPVKLTRGYMPQAEGSCLVEFGNTKVICTATVEEKVPPFLRNSGRGWVTAEYSMLPRSGQTRNQRDKTGPAPRSTEIQRLIGRSLRSVVSMDDLGERSIIIDCDVIVADGGTRTASITGGFVALAEAASWMKGKRIIKRSPILEMVAAISVGTVDGLDVIDLDYPEDSKAAVDMNVVMTDKGKFIEVQGTAEGVPFDRNRLNRLIDLAASGIQQLTILQRAALDGML